MRARERVSAEGVVSDRPLDRAFQHLLVQSSEPSRTGQSLCSGARAPPGALRSVPLIYEALVRPGSVTLQIPFC